MNTDQIRQTSVPRRVLASLLAAVMVLTLLPSPALAAELIPDAPDPACGLTAHTHDEGCYVSTLVCDLSEHTHSDECYAAGDPEPEPGEAPEAASSAYDAAVAAFEVLEDADDLDDDALAELLEAALAAYQALDPDEQETFDEEHYDLLMLALEIQVRLDGGASEPEMMEGEHTHNSVTFTAWNGTTSLPTEEGSYYLTADVTLTGIWNPPSGETNLCLNGHKISLGNYHYVYIKNSKKLNLYDCATSATGSITGGYSGNVGGVWVYGGTFNMYGGSITGNTTTGNIGGAVYVTDGGTFNMHGGSITGNPGNKCGAGVYVSGGAFSMCGGSITGNTANSGAGVYVSGNTFSLSGRVEISGNTVQNGDTTRNVYLSSGTTITIGNDFDPVGTISVDIAKPTDGSPRNITGSNNADHSEKFSSEGGYALYCLSAD